MRVLVYILPFLFTVLFGVFDAAQTARKDYPDTSVFWDHDSDAWQFLLTKRTDLAFRDSVKAGLTEFTTFDLWYVGGNDFYSPPKYFWTADFWHTMKDLWVLCISGIGISCLAVGYLLNDEIRRRGLSGKYLRQQWRELLRLWPYGSYLLLYWLEGATFSFFYHTIFKR